MTTDPDARLRSAIERLRQMPEPDPAARKRLNRQLRLGRSGGTSIVLSRRAALAAAALVVLCTSAVWISALTLIAGPPGAVTATTTPIQFVLVAPDAASVSLVGDFNHWDSAAMPLREGADGVWSVVVPLARGAFTYSFVVDGDEWRADPAAPAAPADFGRPSSVLYVSPESTP